MNRIAGTSLLLLVVLSACGGCPSYIPRVVGCYDVTDLKLPPMALTFQKRGQYGQTNYNQRKEDMIECGIPRERYEDNLYYIRGGPPSETIEQFVFRRKKFLQCIEDKGYDWLGLKECGPVKENRGICK
jgi:hypothetical protein